MVRGGRGHGPGNCSSMTRTPMPPAVQGPLSSGRARFPRSRRGLRLQLSGTVKVGIFNMSLLLKLAMVVDVAGALGRVAVAEAVGFAVAGTVLAPLPASKSAQLPATSPISPVRNGLSRSGSPGSRPMGACLVGTDLDVGGAARCMASRLARLLEMQLHGVDCGIGGQVQCQAPGSRGQAAALIRLLVRVPRRGVRLRDETLSLLRSLTGQRHQRPPGPRRRRHLRRPPGCGQHRPDQHRRRHLAPARRRPTGSSPPPTPTSSGGHPTPHPFRLR